MVSDGGNQLTSADSTVKAESINCQVVEGRETGREASWEYAPTGHQWRSALAKARVKAGKVTLKHMLTQMLRGRKTTLSYDGLCTFLTQAAKVVNVRPVAQQISTTNDSEDDKVDGLLGKHAIKKTVGEEIDGTEDDKPEKTLRSPAGQRDAAGEDNAGHDVREPTLKSGSKMVEEAPELSKADIGEVDETQGSSSKGTLVDPAARKEAIADKTEGAALHRTLEAAAMKGPTTEAIVQPTNKRLAEKGVKGVLGINSEHTATDLDPRGTVGDAATRGGITADNDTDEEIREIGKIEHQDPPELTSSDDDTSDGSEDDFPNETGSERNKVAGRGPGEPLMHVTAPEDVAVENSTDHSLKDTDDLKDRSKETGPDGIAADAPLKKT